MALRHLLLDRLLDISDKLLIEFVAGPHKQEQHDALVIVLWPTLANADGICDLLGEVAFNNGVDLGRPEAHTAGVEHAVGATEEGQVFGNRVVYAEIAVCPDVIVSGEVRGVILCARRARRFLVSPEVYRDVGERFGRYEFTRCSIWNGASRARGQQRVV